MALGSSRYSNCWDRTKEILRKGHMFVLRAVNNADIALGAVAVQASTGKAEVHEQQAIVQEGRCNLVPVPC